MSTNFAELAAQIFRDYVTDGVPASGANTPKKSEVRAYLATVETALLARLSSDVTQDPTVAPYAWAQLARYRSTFTTAI